MAYSIHQIRTSRPLRYSSTEERGKSSVRQNPTAGDVNWALTWKFRFCGIRISS